MIGVAPQARLNLDQDSRKWAQSTFGSVAAQLLQVSPVENDFFVRGCSAQLRGILFALSAPLRFGGVLHFGLLLIAFGATEVSGANLSGIDSKEKSAPGISDIIVLGVGLLAAVAAIVAALITRNPNDRRPPANVNLHVVFVNPPPRDARFRPVPFPNAPLDELNGH